jgi:DNA polymerase-3 subunit gamma/tau
MSYLALARKWRPRTFEDVVGQPHVVRALTNALGSGRVHHAFLFAGTRGVGKTTVARIFARCLSCETGVTATPCGQCAACVGIEEGRFVDLIEVDAASQTSVENIRELLDNVQYTPSSGRYKVYLVDEVHMLSKSAFNALLKTLEEPPPHVKFLFATTDPQKLPVTVLSRCLQFNLKRLPMALISSRMARICDAEGVKFESAALTRIARAAAGSMRDGLSLLDQALAYGNESLLDQDVAEMLGTVDRDRVMTLLQALAGADATALIAQIRRFDELVPDYSSLLDEIATVLQRIAVIQIAGTDALSEEDDPEALVALAAALDPETVQLHYQIAVTGRRDLVLAPDPRVGFEMAMLRMLAFRPAGAVAATPVDSVASTPAQKRVSPGRSSAAPVADAGAEDWATFAASLPLEGAARQLALHTALLGSGAGVLRLGVDPAHGYLLTEQQKARLVAAIQERRGSELVVRIELLGGVADTPAAREAEKQDAALRNARQAIEADPDVQDLAQVFGAELVPGSIKPLKPGKSAGSAEKLAKNSKERGS